MVIISWNVNGLRAVVKKKFLHWLEKINPEIICLQETKLQEEQIPNEILDYLKSKEYHYYFSSAQKKGVFRCSYF